MSIPHPKPTITITKKYKPKKHNHTPIIMGAVHMQRPQSSFNIKIKPERNSNISDCQTIQSPRAHCEINLFCSNEQVKLRKFMLTND